MDCHICKVTFPGIETFKEHESSVSHKNKLLEYQHSNSSSNLMGTISTDSDNSLSCVYCNESFQNVSDFQKHAISIEHALTVMKKSSESATIEKQLRDTTINETRPCQVSQVSSTLSTEPYTRCVPCNKMFTGPESYNQHIASEKHRKKISLQQSCISQLSPQVQQNGCEEIPCQLCNKMVLKAEYYQHQVSADHQSKLSSVSMATTANSNIYCDICNMKFTGPIPYDQHIKGETHKKNVNRSLLLSNYNKENIKIEGDAKAQVGAPNPIIYPYFCEVCNIPCSGPEPYRQHIMSKNHVKNVSKAEFSAKKNELKSLISSTDSKSTSANSTPEKPLIQPNQLKVATSDYPRANSSTTDLGKEIKNELFSNNVGVFAIKPSDLNLTVFKVGDTIDFDKKSGNHIEVNLLEDHDNDHFMEDDDEDI